MTASASGNSGAAVFSADGRHAFFLSTARNLTTNRFDDSVANVFRRELASGAISLVSASAKTRSGGNGSVSAFSASADGCWVAFASRASNLVPSDTNEAEDVFLRDVVMGLTVPVSRGADGTAADEESGVPMISRDGRFVLFESAASNLTATFDTNRTTDVFLWDRDTGRTTLVSKALHGVAANEPSAVD